MSILNMINSVNDGSMFIDPNASALSAFEDISIRIGSLFPQAPGVGDVGAAFAGITSATKSYTKDKLSKITTEIPMMQAVSASAASATQAVAQSDSTNVPTDPNQLISDAFPTSQDGSLTGGPSFDNAFKGLNEGVKAAFDSATASISASFSTMSATMKEMIESVWGKIQDGAAFLKKLKSGKMVEISAINDKMAAALVSQNAGAEAFLTNLKLTVNGILSTVSSALKDFNDVVAKEADALKDAMSFLTNFNFLKMFNTSNPSVSRLMDKISNPDKIDSVALEVINTPVSAYDSPATNAIGTAATISTLEGIPDSSNKKPTLDGVSNRYTIEEINKFKEAVSTKHDKLQSCIVTSAKWLNSNVMEWKKSVKFVEKQNAVGASESDPIGTSKDPVALASWKEVYDAYQIKRTEYNETILPITDKANKMYLAYDAEYKLRKSYGRTPYTTMAERGYPTSAAEQTDYLDPGNK